MNTRVLISVLWAAAIAGASATTKESNRSISAKEFQSPPAELSARGGEQKPNIIVIFTDDMGFADLGFQGQSADLATPHIDRLAAEGIRLTDGCVSAPQCSPSRAGLVTGRYQQRFGLDQNEDVPLPAAETTITDRLKAVGYVTGMVGKWHLEPNALSTKWAEETGKQYQTRPNGRIVVPFKGQLPFSSARSSPCSTRDRSVSTGKFSENIRPGVKPTWRPAPDGWGAETLFQFGDKTRQVGLCRGIALHALELEHHVARLGISPSAYGCENP
ncbi:sulfatase-like hydrolase/transferase [Planctomycetota bacterium]